MDAGTPGGRFEVAEHAKRIRPILERHWLTTAAICDRFGLSKFYWRRVRDHLNLRWRLNEHGVREWHCGPND